MLQHGCFYFWSFPTQILCLYLRQEVMVELEYAVLLAENNQGRRVTASHLPDFERCLLQSQPNRQSKLIMNNIRKVKKKRKVRPTNMQLPSPQQTLIEISNSREEQFALSEADFFLESFKNRPKKQLQKTNIPKFTQSSLSKFDFTQRINLKRKHSIQPSNNYAHHSYSQSHRLKTSPVRFIHLKKNIHTGTSTSRDKKISKRSRTVFDREEITQSRQVHHWKEQSENNSKSTYLNLKESVNAKTINFVRPFIVKNIKLESRYPPPYLQQFRSNS